MPITALVTNYNKPESVVRRCVDSVRSAGLPCVLVDDGSDDRAFLETLECELLLLPKNIGHYRAFRAGLEMVETPYVMRVDSDDYITGAPDVSDGFDAYVNNIDDRISLDPEAMVRRPYAALNGITVKTEVMKKVWFTGLKGVGDLVIFVDLLLNYRCKMNERCLYVYDKRNRTLTRRPFNERQRDLRIARETAKEMIRSKNGGLCR